MPKAQTALKWKKDGTAKCGPLTYKVYQTYKGHRGVNWRAEEPVSGWVDNANSRADARWVSEQHAAKQADQMSKDLMGGK